MINIFSFTLSIIYTFLIFISLSILFDYKITLPYLDKINKMKLLSKQSIFIVLIVFYFLIFGVTKNYANFSLFTSVIIISLSGTIAMILLKLKRPNLIKLNKLKNIFFTMCLFILSYSTFLYPEIFSIAKSGTFNTLTLLIIASVSILSGIILSIDIFYNFIEKKNKIIFLNTTRHKKILSLIILNCLILFLFTEAIFICYIFLILGFLTGLCFMQKGGKIDQNKIQNIIDFLIFILICLISIFINNLLLTIISSTIAGLLIRNNIEEFRTLYQDLIK